MTASKRAVPCKDSIVQENKGLKHEAKCRTPIEARSARLSRQHHLALLRTGPCALFMKTIGLLTGRRPSHNATCRPRKVNTKETSS